MTPGTLPIVQLDFSNADTYRLHAYMFEYLVNEAVASIAKLVATYPHERTLSAQLYFDIKWGRAPYALLEQLSYHWNVKENAQAHEFYMHCRNILYDSIKARKLKLSHDEITGFAIRYTLNILSNTLITE